MGALLLMIGFYVLALGIVATIAGLIVADLGSGHFHLRLVIFGGMAALLVARLQRGELAEDEWHAAVEEAGIAEIELGSLCADANPLSAPPPAPI